MYTYVSDSHQYERVESDAMNGIEIISADEVPIAGPVAQPIPPGAKPAPVTQVCGGDDDDDDV